MKQRPYPQWASARGKRLLHAIRNASIPIASPPIDQSRGTLTVICRFAAGPRACIGAGMAMLEVQLVLAQLLQRFRARPVAGHPIVPQAVVTLKTRHGMPVHITPR